MNIIYTYGTITCPNLDRFQLGFLKISHVEYIKYFTKMQVIGVIYHFSEEVTEPQLTDTLTGMSPQPYCLAWN